MLLFSQDFVAIVILSLFDTKELWIVAGVCI